MSLRRAIGNTAVSGCWSAGSCATVLHLSARHVNISGGGRGDLFTRHVSAYKPPGCGAARGITDVSQSTQPQAGQLHIKKRLQHIQYDRMKSGSNLMRPAIVSWSYLLPSLRQNVEKALPEELYEQLKSGEVPLTAEAGQQLADAQQLLRFELQQRIGLLEDSLAEAELHYLLLWPALFQRAWLRLPMDNKAPPSAEQTANPVQPRSAEIAVTEQQFNDHWSPVSVQQWAVAPFFTAPATSAGIGESGQPTVDASSFASRLVRLTGHVVMCAEAELKALETAAGPREDGAPRSRRQAALEETWRAQWATTLRWHACEAE